MSFSLSAHFFPVVKEEKYMSEESSEGLSTFRVLNEASVLVCTTQPGQVGAFLREKEKYIYL